MQRILCFVFFSAHQHTTYTAKCLKLPLTAKLTWGGRLQGVTPEETEGHVTALIDALKGRKGTAYQRLMRSSQQLDKT